MKINKLLFIAFIVFFGFIALHGCAKREITNIDSQGKNIICFGDSITYGSGANPGEDFPSQLAKMIDIPVINAGVGGETSADALKRLETDVLNKKPFLVIVEFGGNDFLSKVPINETVKNIETMIEKIQEKGAMVALADIHTGLIMGEYAIQFRHLANKHRAIFISALLKDILSNPSLKSDYIHPNAEGYKLIAQRVYDTIRPCLEQNSTLRSLNK